MEEIMIDGERAYPIYQIDAVWEQDIASGDDYSKYPKWTEGLPDGRFRNSAGHKKMLRTDPGIEEVKRHALEEWWPKMLKDKDLQKRNVGEPEITVTGPRWETWCLTWFEHWTFDDGRTDTEYLESFERYVRRYEHMADWSPSQMDEVGDEYVCLMGAEDRWRWHGSEDGSPESRIDPPCRCNHCKDNGVVRIGH